MLLLVAGCSHKADEAKPPPAAPPVAAVPPTEAKPPQKVIPHPFPDQSQYPSNSPPLPQNTPAPDFTTKAMTGRPLSLNSLRGKVVLLDYWATWCGPCQMATPTLEALHRKYHAQGLEVIGIDVDAPDTVSQVPTFIRHFGITYTIAASPKADGLAAGAYQVQGIPSQYLIDKKGIVRWSQSGFDPDEREKLSAMIESLLAESV